MRKTQAILGEQMDIKIGDMVRVNISDAPVFAARVGAIQEDTLMGTAYRVFPTGRAPIWVSQYRIVEVIPTAGNRTRDRLTGFAHD